MDGNYTGRQPTFIVATKSSSPWTEFEAEQSLAGAIEFRLKSYAFQLIRGCRNLGKTPRYGKGNALRDSQVISQSVTPLFTTDGPKEANLTAGKVHNLRTALRQIDGLEIPAGGVFSFWSEIGRPSRRKGYVAGRELRQGCLIPSIGGGLCQLSNALYQCALESRLRILERHTHSRQVPGSAAEAGRDATVFWNYVDLRFTSESPFRIEARLTGESLVVRFKASGHGQPLVLIENPSRSRKVLQFRPLGPASCETCGVRSCFRNIESSENRSAFGRTAFLVDEYWPEFDSYIASERGESDVLGIPIRAIPLLKSNYRWTTSGFKDVGQAPLTVLRRSLALRHLPRQGASRQETLLKYDEKVARRLAALITYDVMHVVVSQNLLPFLWREGHLGGRTFDVLMTRLPMETLQHRLDLAARKHPGSQTLSDFRAPDSILDAEGEALATARKLITPNTEIARLFPSRTVLVDWHIPSIKTKELSQGGSRILFPGAALGRKGAYELREAARFLGLELTVMGGELEGTGFWQGVDVRQAGQNWLDGVGLVVLPAYIEDKPRKLLQAVAHSIPVIASRACGLEAVEGVVTLPDIDARSLAEAIRSHLEQAQPTWPRPRAE
jgi:hypothetical protein